MSIFSSRVKLPLHIVASLVCTGVLAVAGVRILVVNHGRISSRNDTMALAMGAKSKIIILYQILTHFKRFRRWESFKANTILNYLEIVFWAAVTFMTIQGMTQSCNGTSCTLQGVIVGLAVVMCILSFWAAIISHKELRYFKATGLRRADRYAAPDQTELGQQSDSSTTNFPATRPPPAYGNQMPAFGNHPQGYANHPQQGFTNHPQGYVSYSQEYGVRK